MYLTISQQDQLRNIVSNFEIPYRSFVIDRITSAIKSKVEFDQKLVEQSSLLSNETTLTNFRQRFIKYQKESSHIYDLFEHNQAIFKNKKIQGDNSVPNVSDINTSVIIFKELFTNFLIRFNNLETFWLQVEKYKYIRNKLDHPGCINFEKAEVDIVLDFIKNVCLYLDSFENMYFWQESSDNIIRKINVLQKSSYELPIETNNLDSIPSSDIHVVCRNKEISEIKEFVYGKRGALRKKSSYCIYGYGGVGKTALVIESIRQIIQDVLDGQTVNSYCPHFILFYTAKKEVLDISKTSGKIESHTSKTSFLSKDELEKKIYQDLNIENFFGFNKDGIIIIDNLESIEIEEKEKIQDFVQVNSPSNIQYIITSRNEENYEERKHLSGFEEKSKVDEFLKEYMLENDIELSLSDEDIEILTNISRGNTLVLVLSLRRLSENLDTIQGIALDISVTTKKLSDEFSNMPPNGYEIISEFMFKNAFTEIETIYSSNSEKIYSILKIFAAYSSDSIDIYTLSTLSGVQYSETEPIVAMLCQYLILEKSQGFYSINQFAEKYIINRFLPDSETYLQLSNRIESSLRDIKRELNLLEEHINQDNRLKRIMHDWTILTEGDKIAAAKAFKLYEQVKSECAKSSAFFIQGALTDSIQQLEKIEKSTIHPYIKYQKARILQVIQNTGIKFDEYDIRKEIMNSYSDSIWIIKTNPIYTSVQHTKSFPSVLWLFGQYLFENGDLQTSIKYLEDSKQSFESLDIFDREYYKCLCKLGYAYMKKYEENKKENISYLRRSRTCSNILLNNRMKLDRKTKSYSINLRSELQKYGRF